MDRQNIIVGVIAVVVLVAVGVFVFWPEATKEAAVVITPPAAEGSAEGGTTTTESGGY